MQTRRETDLEPLVLQDRLDRDITIGSIVKQPRLEHDTEGAVSDDFAVGIGDFSLVAALAVGGDNLDDFARIIDSCAKRGGISTRHSRSRRHGLRASEQVGRHHLPRSLGSGRWR